MRRTSCVVTCALALLLVAPAARAVPGKEKLSTYEQETLDRALESRKTALDPNPDGKLIESVEIEVLDVIEDRDLLGEYIGFLNALHANSQEEVIRRELLFHRGQRWDHAIISESERNLRGLRQESLVIIAPLTGSAPDRVRVVVICKDVWSLRLNNDFRLKNGQLEYLFVQPAEENLLGTHRRIFGAFVYQPHTLAFGARAEDPRIAGSRYYAVADGNVIVNQDSGDAEGSYGFFQYGLPLYSTRQQWAWDASAQWNYEISRRTVGTDIAGFDAESTEEVDLIPYVYRSDVIAGRIRVIRSFGSDVKHDLSAAMDASRRSFKPEGDLSAFDPAAVSEFLAELPRSETRIGPAFQYHLYLNEFVSLLDVDTLGLQESYVLGPELYLGTYPITELLGSTRDVIGFYSSAAYTLHAQGGLLRLYGAAALETEVDPGRVSDLLFQTGMRAVSPNFVIGRLIYDGAFIHRAENGSNSFSTLGGDGRLRGYASMLDRGKDLIASNLELRSRSFDLWSVQVAGALYYDLGDAFDGFDDLHPKQGAGFGLRMLLPQIGRNILRVDWGFALTPDSALRAEGLLPPSSPFEGLVVTFHQAFGTPRPSGSSVSLSPK